MSAEFVRHLVREWVGLYTHGLPAEVRVGRIDEIESDLWSHAQEAESRAEADSALAIAILTRWLLGIDADIAWRLERGRLADRNTERITTMGTRIAAILAIVGGAALAISVTNWAITDLGSPGAHQWEKAGWTPFAIVGAVGIVALSVGLGRLGFVILNRDDSPVGLVAELGAIGGVMGLIGAYATLALLPVGSIAVSVYLARIHAVRWSIAAIHVVSAPGLVLGLAAYSNSGLIGISTLLILTYCLTWILMGLELLGGLPLNKPATSSAP